MKAPAAPDAPAASAVPAAPAIPKSWGWAPAEPVVVVARAEPIVKGTHEDPGDVKRVNSWEGLFSFCRLKGRRLERNWTVINRH